MKPNEPFMAFVIMLQFWLEWLGIHESQQSFKLCPPHGKGYQEMSLFLKSVSLYGKLLPHPRIYYDLFTRKVTSLAQFKEILPCCDQEQPRTCQDQYSTWIDAGSGAWCRGSNNQIRKYFTGTVEEFVACGQRVSTMEQQTKAYRLILTAIIRSSTEYLPVHKVASWPPYKDSVVTSFIPSGYCFRSGWWRKLPLPELGEDTQYCSISYTARWRWPSWAKSTKIAYASFAGYGRINAFHLFVQRSGLVWCW